MLDLEEIYNMYKRFGKVVEESNEHIAIRLDENGHDLFEKSKQAFSERVKSIVIGCWKVDKADQDDGENFYDLYVRKVRVANMAPNDPLPEFIIDTNQGNGAIVFAFKKYLARRDEITGMVGEIFSAANVSFEEGCQYWFEYLDGCIDIWRIKNGCGSEIVSFCPVSDGFLKSLINARISRLEEIVAGIGKNRTRLVDANKIIARLDRMLQTIEDEKDIQMVSFCKDIVGDAPTEESPCRNGEWIGGKCSNCGCIPWYGGSIGTLRYCPQCGSRMVASNE